MLVVGEGVLEAEFAHDEEPDDIGERVLLVATLEGEWPGERPSNRPLT